MWYKAADKLAHLLYYDLWGQRQFKYNFLSESSVDSIGEDWIELEPTHPNFFFSPKDFDLNDEYKKLVSIEEILMLNSSGIKTHHDHFVIDFEVQTLERRMSNFISLDISDQEIKDLYKLEVIALSDVASMRKAVSRLNIGTTIKPILYRPFDVRHLFYDESCCERLRTEVMDHLLKENLCLIVCRQQKELGFYHSFVTEYVGDGNTISIKSREYNYYFPLYRYPETENDQGSLFVERSSNISSNFLSVVREKLGYVPTPEAIFYYIYAIFHSPTYRQRYAEFLKIDFPRVPLTSDDQLFKDLGTKGQALVDLHLMKSKKLNKLITKMSGDGDNAVTEVTYKPTEQRVYINGDRYFEGIAPEVWEFKIGGYQVLDKWLKDRKKAKRTLSFDDVLHYQKIVVALKETMQLMVEIDQLIPGFPIA